MTAGESHGAQAAGVVGRQQDGALVGGEAEPAALVGFDNGMVRVSHSGSYYDRDDPAATKIIRRWGPRLQWKNRRVAPIRTDEDTIALVRRLAIHHPDPIIAAVLNRQGKRSATGERFNAGRVGSLRPLLPAKRVAIEGTDFPAVGVVQRMGCQGGPLLLSVSPFPYH